ncbi:MAG: hypothetical protein QM762_14685 [Chryseolinea sp.]
MPLTESIDWTDADTLVQAFKEFILTNKLGPTTAFAIDRKEIEKVLNQDGKELQLRIYLAFSREDKAFTILPIACEHDSASDSYKDYKIPLEKPSDPATLPMIAAARPCPPRCSELNFLNR